MGQHDHELAATGSGTLSQQQQQAQRTDHRAQIALRVTVILGQFWQDNDSPDAVRALEIEGWCDVLEPCTQDEIRRGWANYQISGPRTSTGRLYKPDAGAILALIWGARHREALARPQRPASAPEEEPRIAVTPEQREQIMRDVYRNGAIANEMPTADQMAAAVTKKFGGRDV